MHQPLVHVDTSTLPINIQLLAQHRLHHWCRAVSQCWTNRFLYINIVRTHLFFKNLSIIWIFRNSEISLPNIETENWIWRTSCMTFVIHVVNFHNTVMFSVHLMHFCDHHVQQVDIEPVKCTIYYLDEWNLVRLMNSFP